MCQAFELAGIGPFGLTETVSGQRAKLLSCDRYGMSGRYYSGMLTVLRGTVANSTTTEERTMDGQVPVGVIGLGDMAGAIARSLLAAGYPVVGYDPHPATVQRPIATGGTAVDGAAAVGEAAEVVITCVPTAAALHATLPGHGGLLSSTTSRARIIVETSTFDLATKYAGRDTAAAVGTVMLDCPISGTSHQAADRDLVIYASGQEALVAEVAPILSSFSPEVLRIGPHGDGSEAKRLANLMVGIHNAAAAEALTLATKAGMDPQRVFEALVAGAADSRMLQVRGPFMLEGGLPRRVQRRSYLREGSRDHRGLRPRDGLPRAAVRRRVPTARRRAGERLRPPRLGCRLCRFPGVGRPVGRPTRRACGTGSRGSDEGGCLG